jgi:hypothetical protein
MSPELFAKLIQYMALVPGAIEVVSKAVQAVKDLLARGGQVPTDEEIADLVNQIVANHEALPKPE